MFIEQTYQCKNGQVVRIREANVDDAGALNALKLCYIDQSDYIPMSSDEYQYNIEGEREMIEVISLRENSVLLLVEQDGFLIGNIDLVGSQRDAMSHVAMLGMGIHQNWRNIGVGGFLMEAALHWAKTSAIIEIICLDVYDDNLPAISLYTKFGFKSYGKIPGYFKKSSHRFALNRMMLKI